MLEGSKRMNCQGDLLKCQSPLCDQSVRIYSYLGQVIDFRCAKCLEHLTFDTVPIIGCYTQCVDCKGQFKVMVNGCNQCFVCKPVSGPEPYPPPIDPETHPNCPKPDICPSCGENSDCEWTYDPYCLDIYERYDYSWFCSVCLKDLSENI